MKVRSELSRLNASHFNVSSRSTESEMTESTRMKDLLCSIQLQYSYNIDESWRYCHSFLFQRLAYHYVILKEQSVGNAVPSNSQDHATEGRQSRHETPDCHFNVFDFLVPPRMLPEDNLKGLADENLDLSAFRREKIFELAISPNSDTYLKSSSGAFACTYSTSEELTGHINISRRFLDFAVELYSSALPQKHYNVENVAQRARERSRQRSECVQSILTDIRFRIERASSKNLAIKSIEEFELSGLTAKYPYLTSENSLKTMHIVPEGQTPSSVGGSTDSYIIYNPLSQDPKIERERVELIRLLNRLFHTIFGLTNLFVSLQCSHTLLRKVWGSYQTIAVLLENIFYDYMQGETRGQDDFWMIIDLTEKRNNIASLPTPEPTTALFECLHCTQHWNYPSQEDALEHLRRCHFSEFDASTNSPRTEDLLLWIVRASQIRMAVLLRNIWHLLRTVVEHLERIFTRASLVRYSTIGTIQESRDSKLPYTIVLMFGQVIRFFLHTACTMTQITEHFYSLPVTQPIVGEVDLCSQYTDKKTAHLVKLAEYILLFLDSTESNFVLLNRTIVKSPPRRTLVSPELLLGKILTNLQSSVMRQGERIDFLSKYGKFSMRLRYQITHSPRRRLLRDVIYLQEEIEAIRKVNDWQRTLFESICKVLQPRSLNYWTQIEAPAVSIESNLLLSASARLASKDRKFLALCKRLQSMKDAVRQNIEILEEDHGKAILVFTMVTIVFLPLSFITSFFGMNVSDLRNMDKTQTIFWSTALPVTGTVVCAALVVAYQGDKLQDMMVNYRLKRENPVFELPPDTSTIQLEVWRRKTQTSLQLPRPWWRLKRRSDKK
ncbi:hypothetical protein M501DRAFT_1056889 [Patellaria atrata CBS 101060]|uniref:DUF7896 domain-containing protein n=1 Tax=Patellaria atrata CBS 101060 TaxID=1346257 RepID=A0A9P4VS56_9PEZI|nr:hypothetical protein M501DRAFT_1056889 [Patellaria atrata CBS 101060]